MPRASPTPGPRRSRPPAGRPAGRRAGHRQDAPGREDRPARAPATAPTVLHGRCDEDVQAPYAPWIDALRQYARARAQAVLERHVGAHGGELSRLARRCAPQAGASATERDRSGGRALPAVRRRRGHARRGGRGPPADALPHRRPALGRQADPAAAAGTSSRRARRTGCCSSAPTATPTSRPSTRSPPCSPTCAASPECERIGLTGLGETDVVELMESGADRPLRSDERGLARDLARETNGNPFFLTEMLRHLRGGRRDRARGRRLAADRAARRGRAARERARGRRPPRPDGSASPSAACCGWQR